MGMNAGTHTHTILRHQILFVSGQVGDGVCGVLRRRPVPCGTVMNEMIAGNYELYTNVASYGSNASSAYFFRCDHAGLLEFRLG